MKKILATLTAVLLALSLSGCFSTSSDVATHNLKKEAEEFKILRRIVFLNTWTGKYELEIQGYCSMEPSGNRLHITCKKGNEYLMHTQYLTGHMTATSEQLTTAEVSAYHYKVIFKPDVIIPDFDISSQLNK